jgi:hypothetical protein
MHHGQGECVTVPVFRDEGQGWGDLKAGESSYSRVPSCSGLVRIIMSCTRAPYSRSSLAASSGWGDTRNQPKGLIANGQDL